MSVATGRELGVELCKIFGFDPNIVNHITIDIPSDGVVTVSVTQFVNNFDACEVNITVNNPESIKQIASKFAKLIRR